MTHKERMAALVEAGAVRGVDDEDGHADWFSEEDRKFHMTCTAARPSIALALEIVEAVRECRRLDKAKLDFSETGEAACFATAYARLDTLLQRWEGKQ